MLSIIMINIKNYHEIIIYKILPINDNKYFQIELNK